MKNKTHLLALYALQLLTILAGEVTSTTYQVGPQKTYTRLQDYRKRDKLIDPTSRKIRDQAADILTKFHLGKCDIYGF